MNPSRVPFVCSSCARAARAATISQTTRQFSLTTPRSFNDSVPEDASASIPRWMKTPQRLRQPIRLRPRSHQSATWRVNTDPEKLNAAYDNFLGRVGGNRLRGRDLLDEQTKVSFIRCIASIQLISSNSMNSVTNKLVQWLATTHKSHEHGAQGFNSRLAYLGKRILDLQTSLALLSQPQQSPLEMPAAEVYQHPSLQNLENITLANKASALHKSRLSALASEYGLDKVVRWKPKNSEDMKSSGMDAVMAEAIYAIIGAVALQRGGDIAGRVARERVLAPLGLR